MRFFIVSILALGALAGLMPAPAKADDARICAQMTAHVEQQYRLPAMLLGAVAVTESGRYDRNRRANSAWPWTLNAEGKGQFFDTKAQAVAAVKQLQKRGVKSIDVGCMQVNLFHHPDAFMSVEEALDPAANVDYAARFLLELKDKTRSWHQAVAAYHSQTATLGGPYRQKVMQAWGKEVIRDGEERRQSVLAQWQERREAALAKAQAMVSAREASIAAARARSQQLARIEIRSASFD